MVSHWGAGASRVCKMRSQAWLHAVNGLAPPICHIPEVYGFCGAVTWRCYTASMPYDVREPQS